MAQATIRRNVGRVLSASAGQIAEAVLAKALTGDVESQKIFVELLKFAFPDTTTVRIEGNDT